MREIEAICKYKACGRIFKKDTPHQKYCSIECRKAARNRTPRRYKMQPCWTCKNYIDGCSWSRSFKPVKGWEAEKVARKYGEEVQISYKIIKCPEYIYDYA